MKPKLLRINKGDIVSILDPRSVSIYKCFVHSIDLPSEKVLLKRVDKKGERILMTGFDLELFCVLEKDLEDGYEQKR